MAYIDKYIHNFLNDINNYTPIMKPPQILNKDDLSDAPNFMNSTPVQIGVKIEGSIDLRGAELIAMSQHALQDISKDSSVFNLLTNIINTQIMPLLINIENSYNDFTTNLSSATIYTIE
jgi:hypothetical protein